MAKNYKIKRSRKYSAAGSSYRAGPGPLSVVLTIVVLAGLLFVGINIYEPFMKFITSDHSAGEVSMPEAETSSEVPTESLPEQEPEPEPEPAATSELRSVYLPIDTARDDAALDAFLNALTGTEINAVMLDIKNASGQVLFATTNEQAAAWNAQAENPVDLAALGAKLEAKGLALVARMSTFRDPIAAGAVRDNAIKYGDSSDWLWLDIDQKPWLNPYAEGARSYLTALAVEAADAGAKMIVLGDMHFPYGSANFANLGPDAETISRPEMLSKFVEELSAQMEAKGVRTAVYMSASSIVAENENATRYGGSPLEVRVGTLMIGALPYQFSGDYSTGGLTVAQPLQNPAGVTASVLEFITAAYAGQAGDAPAIIPLLQGGVEDPTTSPYTAEQIQAQVSAVETAGLREYVLYQTAGTYLLTSEGTNGNDQQADPASA